MGASPDDDSVPVVMGFLPTPVNGKDDRPVTLYAGSLTCINTKLEQFCASDANRGERVCQLYKQVYLNDAAILYNRLLRNRRREMLHTINYERAASHRKRGPAFTRAQFDAELIQLQDAYIEFLQQTCIGMLLESGAQLNNVPLQLLEPRELEVSLYAEDTDMVGNDYLTPRTAEILKDMDPTKDNLSRTQLAILSLIPPNHRILSTLRPTRTPRSSTSSTPSASSRRPSGRTRRCGSGTRTRSSAAPSPPSCSRSTVPSTTASTCPRSRTRSRRPRTSRRG